MFKHILIPTDGSPVSAKAIKAGVKMATQTGARVTGYCAIEPPQMHVRGASYELDPKLQAALDRSARKAASRHVVAIGKAARAAGIEFELLVTESPAPYMGIIDAARTRKCDVIFMASHGRRGIGALIMGSTTNKVLTHSKIPVLVYR